MIVKSLIIQLSFRNLLLDKICNFTKKAPKEILQTEGVLCLLPLLHGTRLLLLSTIKTDTLKITGKINKLYQHAQSSCLQTDQDCFFGYA
jgi:hypothetical protein